MSRIDERRQRFLEANTDQHLIEFNETTPFSQGRWHRTHKFYIPKGAPRDWRRILCVQKPRVFFSELSDENVGNCTMHQEFTLDTVVEIIGPYINVMRQRIWEENKDRGILNYSTRDTPPFDRIARAGEVQFI